MNSPGSGRQPFVFHDPAGKRWPRLRRWGLLIGLLLFIALVSFVQSLFVTPELRLPASVRKLKGQLKAIQQQKAAANGVAPIPKTWEKHLKHPAGEEPTAKVRSKSQSQSLKRTKEIRAGFYAAWDPNSVETLQHHAGQLTHVCYDWGTFADSHGNITVNFDPELQKIAASRGLVTIPILTNRTTRRWQPEFVESLANGPVSRRNHFITELVKALDIANAGGVLLHFEELDPAYQPGTTALLEALAKELHASGKQLWLTVSMGEAINTFDLPKLMPTVDRFVATLTDETSEDEEPGSVASQDWFEGWLKVIAGYGKPEKWIATIGTQGCDWIKGVKKGEVISFADVMSRANYAGLDKVTLGPPSYNPTFSYQEPGWEHTVCFLDAISFLNQLRATRESDLGGIAIARLGTEDPDIWAVLAMGNLEKPTGKELKTLASLETADLVTHVGQGEMVTVDDAQRDGHREIKMDDDGRYVATYNAFPAYPVVFHEGAGDPRAVALTFDDGPDPDWTPKILKILRERGVKATFFIVGNEAEAYPNLVRQIVAEGHIIGNHSYTHAHFGEISDQQIRLELNATQRLLEAIIGRSTTLVRPPYNADARPTKLEELRPLKIVQDDLGYLIVLESIDPKDWARPGVDEMLQTIKAQRDEGNIILLHDAGGNRSQTVEALPKILDYIEERGDYVVSLSELLHIPTDDLMPLVQPGQKWTRLITGTGFSIWHRVEQALWAFMIAATGLVVLRSLLIMVLAIRHYRQAPPFDPDFHPPVSVLIAAYNEEKVIHATLASVLESDYAGPLEIVVVDDGSTDGTATLVETIASNREHSSRRIQLIRQANGGKAIALTAAVKAATAEILVFLDADTHFERAAIAKLVQPLADVAVGAVSGHAKVGNQRTFIARCQALEYSCGFNLDRRAYAVWNCITVAPGAISAIRRSALMAADGFSLDTLAEDTDLTLSLHRSGYRVAYSHEAIAWTEAPESITTLAKQRLRWAFGTLQCLWKHRDLVFNPDFKALGWFALPSVWFCQVVLVAITPLVDVLLIFSLLSGYAGTMILFFAAFVAMDLLLALLACLLDKEPIRKAAYIIPMRLLYRPLLSWVIWRSMLKATKGAWVTWGKLERTASVIARPEPPVAPSK